MKILGIDTSSKYLSIALSEDDSIIVEHSLLLDRKHSSLLIPKINQMLKEKNVSIVNIPTDKKMDKMSEDKLKRFVNFKIK